MYMKRFIKWYLGDDKAVSDEKVLARRQKFVGEAKAVAEQAVDVIATGAVAFYAVARNIR